MIKTEPFIYAFKTQKGYYIYDVNTNRILKVHKDVYDNLNRKNTMEKNNSTESKIQSMKNDGFLSSHRLKEIIHPENELLEFHIKNKVSLLILQVTQQCNLRCNYCPYSGGYYNRSHQNKKMSFEIAKKGIDFLIENSMDSQKLSVSFYGGEPLLEMELIKKCIDYCKKNCEGKDILFSMTTNGTLITEEIIELFNENELSLTISLDGPENIHNKNRDLCNGKGSFNTVMQNVEMIKEKFPDYFKTITFNCVLDPKNDFSCTNKFFTTYDTIKDSNIAFNEINTQYSKTESIANTEEYYQRYNYEIFKMFLYRINKLDEKHVSKIVKEYYEYLNRVMNNHRYADKLHEKGHHSGPCIPGVQRLFVNIYGDLYPCERVSEDSEIMKIGHVDEGFYIEKIRALLNVGKLTEDKCKNCWSYRFCTLCASAADNFTELSKEKKETFCRHVLANADAMLKDYCSLKELGDTFNGDNCLMNYA